AQRRAVVVQSRSEDVLAAQIDRSAAQVDRRLAGLVRHVRGIAVEEQPGGVEAFAGIVPDVKFDGDALADAGVSEAAPGPTNGRRVCVGDDERQTVSHGVGPEQHGEGERGREASDVQFLVREDRSRFTDPPSVSNATVPKGGPALKNWALPLA